MKIVLIRHGQTAGNLEKRYIGCRTDEPLAEAFREETLSVGESLRKKLPEGYVCLSGSMLRCIQTAGLLTGDFGFTVCDDIREMDFGRFEGKNYKELTDDPDYKQWIDSGGSIAFPDGESREQFMSRNITAFKRIISENEGREFLLLVCHGGTIMSIMSYLTGLDYYDFSVPNLDGYFLDLKLCGDDWDVYSYDRLRDWLSA